MKMSGKYHHRRAWSKKANNSQKMHTEILQQLGIPKNEAKIYESLISIGPSGVARISSVSKVNRRNVYDSLNNLVKRNLVERVVDVKQQQYRALDPEKLREITSFGCRF